MSKRWSKLQIRLYGLRTFRARDSYAFALCLMIGLLTMLFSKVTKAWILSMLGTKASLLPGTLKYEVRK